ncbi:hypothetical protein D3C72_682020 [compost metagenome]
MVAVRHPEHQHEDQHQPGQGHVEREPETRRDDERPHAAQEPEPHQRGPGTVPRRCPGPDDQERGGDRATDEAELREQLKRLVVRLKQPLDRAVRRRAVGISRQKRRHAQELEPAESGPGDRMRPPDVPCRPPVGEPESDRDLALEMSHPLPGREGGKSASDRQEPDHQAFDHPVRPPHRPGRQRQAEQAAELNRPGVRAPDQPDRHETQRQRRPAPGAARGDEGGDRHRRGQGQPLGQVVHVAERPQGRAPHRAGLDHANPVLERPGAGR